MKSFMYPGAGKALLLGLVLSVVAGEAQAQLAQKPSVYRQQRMQQGLIAGGNGTAAHAALRGPQFLHDIQSEKDFLSLARIYDAGTPFEIPHALFLIDREHDNTVYFINTSRVDLHEKFIQQHFHITLNHHTQLLNYQDPNRRFLLGTVSWQAQTRQWTYEFWEGDRLTLDLLNIANTVLPSHFFQPLIFKSNSSAHEHLAQAAGVAFVAQRDLIKQQTYLPLNEGRAQGFLRRIDSDDDWAEVGPHDIVVLKSVPLTLPPVAGVITEQPSTMLSHVNVLSRSWKIPNMYLKGASSALAAWFNKPVDLAVGAKAYTLTELSAEQLKFQPLKALDLQLASAKDELAWRSSPLRALNALRASDANECGAKAANLGQIRHWFAQDTASERALVPDGFCIAFKEYRAFMARRDVQAHIRAALATPHFSESRRVRAAVLSALREQLIAMPLPEAQTERWAKAWRGLGGQGVFARSSSNAEDLPNFSGAGLFSSVPNVVNDAQLAQAVKTVWASVFNLEAFEQMWRTHASFSRLAMGVLVQIAIPSQSAGVMVSTNPYDPKQADAVLISAKKGLGIRVVEGQKLAEEYLYVKRGDVVQKLRVSDDDTALVLDEQGGVKEVPVDAQAVLSDQQVRALAQVALGLHRQFGRTQDIEWAFSPEGRLVVLQSRAYR